MHVGDITKLSGYRLEPPDVVTGGSPCQDLSVAGKRKGLIGERSGLFMKQIRLIKELRYTDASRGCANDLIRPRYMVWENVVGAFSSNKGEDFRIVLEETARIVQPDAVIPQPPKGKWRNAGAIMGDGWSIAWRVFNSKFWGVPQRRRRIALVGDFGGQSAPEILFIRKGLSGDFEESGEAGEGIAGDAESGIDHSGEACDVVSTDNVWPETVGSLVARADGSPCINRGQPFVAVGSNCLTPWESQRRRIHSANGASPTLDGSDGGGGRNPGGLFLTAGFNGHKSVTADICYNVEHSPCMESNMPPNALVAGFKAGQGAKAGGIGWQEEVAPALMSAPSGSNMVPAVAYTQKRFGEYTEGFGTITTTTGAGGTSETLIFENHAQDSRITGPLEASPTVSKKWGTGGNNTPIVMAHGQANAEILTDLSPTLNCNHEQPIVAGLDCRNGTENGELCATLQSKPGGGYSLNCTHPVRIGLCVRRLTPLECERLQGYPDGWTDIGDWSVEKVWTDKKRKTKTVRKSSDSLRYKALGNSIALPPWKWVLKRISAQYERDATLGSLFDGIGGFSFLWEQINGKGSTLWASEVEEFCIAVTERRINDIERGAL